MISTVISSSILIIIITLLRVILKGKISSRLQYAIWGLVLIRALLPFSFYSSSVSIMNVKPIATIGNISENHTNNSQNIYNTKISSIQKMPTTPIINPNNKPKIIQSPQNILQFLKKHANTVFGMTWLCGMLIMGLWFAITNIRFYMKLRNLRKPYADVYCKLPVYIINELSSPCLFGVFRPKIYLTTQAVKDEVTTYHVITHEMTHYEHRDHLWTLLGSIALIIHWFNPLMWLGLKLSKIDCELSCDEATVKKLGEENRIRYGRTLVDLVSIDAKKLDLICASTIVRFKKSEMKQRIIMVTNKPKTVITAITAVVFILIATAFCTFTGASNSINSKLKTPVNKEVSRDNLIKILKAALPKGTKLVASYIDNFNKDNKLELFGVVNTGVWYADENGAKKLFEGGLYPDTAVIWDVGKQRLFKIEEGYNGSGSCSHVWSVRNGRPYELKDAGERLEYEGNLQFYTYPGDFDLMCNGQGGHTWKQYYLYLNQATGTFREYGGISIARKQLLKLNGTSKILKEMDKKGYKITDILYRKNNIININYTDGKYNLNLTLTIKKNMAFSDNPNLIINTDGGGTYKAALFKDIATYPKKFNY